MKRDLRVAFAAGALFLILGGRSFAVSFDLTDEQLSEAVEYGRQGGNNLSLGSEWTVTKPGLKGWVEVKTPFKAAAEFVRNNPSRKRFANSELREVIEPLKGNLIFTYYHYKLDDEFTQRPSPTGEYYAFLMAGEKYVYPLRYTTGTRFKEISLDFVFPAEDIEEGSQIKFVFREPSGFQRDFVFDLDKIR
ncbi:MAG: hypothetical protein PHR44_04900 [Candidatus Omnitrophica bacterium]|nr:hypothetical protein [Candidatus Omnitrophota bacterium]